MRSREALDRPRRSGWPVDLVTGREMDKRAGRPSRKGEEQNRRDHDFAHQCTIFLATNVPVYVITAAS